MSKNQRLGIDHREREAANRRYLEQKMVEEREKEAEETRRLKHEHLRRIEALYQKVGETIKSVCTEEAYKFFAVERSGRSGVVERRERRLQVASSTLQGPSAPGEGQRRDDVQYCSRDLEDCFDREAIMINRDEAAVVFVDWAVVAALEDWTIAVKSQLLCIVGPNQMTYPSATSFIAAKYAASASQAQLPVVSFFCEPSCRNVPYGSTPEAEALMSLIYALIRQLIEHLPPVFKPKTQLQMQKFEVLDGSLESWDDAIGILKGLLDLSPPVLFCIIDGFEKLDDHSTREYMADLIDALRGYVTANENPTGSEGILKVLFTTAGRSRCLLQNLAESELVFAEQSSAGRRPGKPSPGRRTLSPAAFLRNIEGRDFDGLLTERGDD